MSLIYGFVAAIRLPTLIVIGDGNKQDNTELRRVSQWARE